MDTPQVTRVRYKHLGQPFQPVCEGSLSEVLTMGEMTDEDIVQLLLLLGIFALLAVTAIALTAGNITSDLLSPLPSIAGPIGAAVALGVFVIIVLKLLSMLLN